MPPKVKITKNNIIDTALSIVQKHGVDALNARNIASVLNCSTQPIFSNFSSIDELKFEIIKKAETLAQKYIQSEIEKNEFPPYKASGMGYIRFANEEKELFKLLYMRNRSNEMINDENDLFQQMIGYVTNCTGLLHDQAKLFHLEIWAVVHGIATMLATNYLTLDWELISHIITDVYEGLKTKHAPKE